MHIISKETLRRNYQYLSSQTAPQQALQDLARQYDLPAEVVAEAVLDEVA